MCRFFFNLNYLNTTYTSYNTKQLQVLLTIIQYTLHYKTIWLLIKLVIEFIHYLQKLYEYIGYLHPYCNNEQQNKDYLITY